MKNCWGSKSAFSYYIPHIVNVQEYGLPSCSYHYTFLVDISFQLSSPQRFNTVVPSLCKGKTESDVSSIKYIKLHITPRYSLIVPRSVWYSNVSRLRVQMHSSAGNAEHAMMHIKLIQSGLK